VKYNNLQIRSQIGVVGTTIENNILAPIANGNWSPE
jgi:hypothetical protein